MDEVLIGFRWCQSVGAVCVARVGKGPELWLDILVLVVSLIGGDLVAGTGVIGNIVPRGSQGMCVVVVSVHR